MITHQDRTYLNSYYFYYLTRILEGTGPVPQNEAKAKEALVWTYIAENNDHLHTAAIDASVSNYINNTILADSGFLTFFATF